jgi:type III pantothenate kinase
LVIDAGSCITYDFLSASHQYLGGYISLGLEMRFKALEHFTAKLPLLSSQDSLLSHIGKTTHDAIHGGVVNGFIYEIEGVIQKYINNSSNVRVLICGGDANFIHNNIQYDSEVIETLVLEGLQAIYSHIQ